MVNTLRNRKADFSTAIDGWLDNLSRTGRGKKQALSIVVDLATVLIALWCAYSLRLGYLYNDFQHTWLFFLALPPITVLVIASLGIYRWVVRSSNRVLVFQLVKVCIVSALSLVLFAFLFPPESANSRSIFVIYGLLLGIGLASTRLLWQVLVGGANKGEPIGIYGAGAAGASLIHSLNQGREYRPVIMIDDDPSLAKSRVGGVMVHHSGETNLKELLHSLDVSRIVLAMPKIGAREYEEKVAVFRDMGFVVQTVPTYAELVTGSATMEQIRDISIADILGRSEVPPNPDLLGKSVTGKVVMITGAGGSIGSELCRQIAKQKPAKLVALDHSEENLYKITEELRDTYDEHLSVENLITVLGTINDTAAVSDLVSKYNVHSVFHAAAYKHVPIVEAQPEQGVKVNIFGTLSVLEASIKHQVENFVLISTDKAVRPTNAMGATKRVAELILQAKAKSESSTKISMVRFGNVLGSSGSVVPKFKKQIEAGGPITLTDPNVTRYFMTIPEAAQLVLQASAIAKGGDVFVLDMGEPVCIEDLAVSMVRLSGKRLARETGNGNDIEIVVSGLRPGEKMYEELFVSETQAATDVPKVYTADETWMSWERLNVVLDELSYLGAPTDREKIRALLLRLAFHGQPATGVAQLKDIEPIRRTSELAEDSRRVAQRDG
jgi:FlaA1/EpsC-like NDP-sugar epimerase